MRVVLDTNVFISGIFWEGNFCSQIIEAWQERKFSLITSLDIVVELVKTLQSFKIRMPEEMIEEWRNMVLENACVITPTMKIEIIKEDPDDNKFLEVALAGNASIIVSQDKHLLKLREYQGIKILKPQDFLKIIHP